MKVLRLGGEIIVLNQNVHMGVIQEYLHVHVVFVREFHVMILSLVCTEQLAPNLRQLHPSEDA